MAFLCKCVVFVVDYYCDIVQYTYADGSTELGNYENGNKVGPHVYMEKCMLVFL
jgi:hypothetical protein